MPKAKNTLQLAGSAILVTGASTGIGAATVRALGAAGARVGLVARRKELLDQVAQETRDAGAPDVEVWAADLSDLPLAEQDSTVWSTTPALPSASTSPG
jgi:short-subunit dehydrogenase